MIFFFRQNFINIFLGLNAATAFGYNNITNNVPSSFISNLQQLSESSNAALLPSYSTIGNQFLAGDSANWNSQSRWLDQVNFYN